MYLAVMSVPCDQDVDACKSKIKFIESIVKLDFAFFNIIGTSSFSIWFRLLCVTMCHRIWIKGMSMSAYNNSCYVDLSNLVI